MMVAYGPGFGAMRATHAVADTVTLDGVPITVGIRHATVPSLPLDDDEHAVHLRVLAFSCNYRDKALLLRVATHGRADGFMAIGSEFVAEVVATGALVTQVRIGDRVIGNNTFPGAARVGGQPGIPTNHASREFIVLRGDKVMRVPAWMPDVDAAALSLGAQTAYSMVRRLDISPGERVLVTAARANTSLFVIGALRARGARVFATTTDAGAAARLLSLGVEAVFPIAADVPCFTAMPALVACAREGAGFDAAVDPFFDLHFRKLVPLLRMGGRYITCGCHTQGDREPSGAHGGGALFEALQIVMMRNIQVIGNCLGEHDDLADAIAAYSDGRLTVFIDSVFSGRDAGAFIHRTYADRARFGKAVFAYG